MESNPRQRTAREMCQQMNRDYIFNRRDWKNALKRIIKNLDNKALTELEPIATLIWFQKQSPDNDEINKLCATHVSKILCYKYNWMYKRVLVAAHNEDWADVKHYKQKLYTRMNACLDHYEEDMENLNITTETLSKTKEHIGEDGYLNVANIFRDDWFIVCDLATNPVYQLRILSDFK